MSYYNDQKGYMQFKVNEVLLAALTRIADKLAGSADNIKKSDDVMKMSRGYPYVPYRNYQELIPQLLTIQELNPSKRLKFIDVGCGIGLISNLAASMGYIASGVDLIPEYIDFGKKFVSSIPKLFCDDAFNINYKEYDVIYYYCPIRDRATQIRLEKHIEKTMRVGAYLIPKMKQGWQDRKSGKWVLPDNFKGVSEPRYGCYGIYQKVRRSSVLKNK